MQNRVAGLTVDMQLIGAGSEGVGLEQECPILSPIEQHLALFAGALEHKLGAVGHASDAEGNPLTDKVGGPVHGQDNTRTRRRGRFLLRRVDRYAPHERRTHRKHHKQETRG